MGCLLMGFIATVHTDLTTRLGSWAGLGGLTGENYLGTEPEC